MAQAAAEASSGSKAANVSTAAAAVEHGPFMVSSFPETGVFQIDRHSFSSKFTFG
ncbi:hypothetical protein QTI17_30150 [Variovorax sp. J31P179]|uniref:hypothetical protein n=1 Tax=Variovorax sp. J31P179 TaxID=3053508 RepID=UPI0025769B90|nr:hypothetical protein [Variovorax sp. J31P179]MDM0084868.1 hypothetical protein [Variovorax sp. J31P179]